MGDLAERTYSRFAGLLPSGVAGRLDRFWPSLAESWGGPLNGQVHRRQIVRELVAAGGFDRIVETGTYRGTSTDFFAAITGVPIQTVEGNERFYVYSARRFQSHPSVSVVLGDSREFLRGVASTRASPDEAAFFYLDAHWETDLPLAAELGIISENWNRSVVMIDDFQVPDDPGYFFDDYGPGKRLSRDYLPAAVSSWRVGYPSAPSSEETGQRRGCCVMVSPAMGELVVPSLRWEIP